jgi:MFS family permease
MGEATKTAAASGGAMTGASRSVLFWMCVLIGVNQLGFGAMIPVLPLYAQSFGVTSTAIGMAIAVYGLARFAAPLPAGRVADRIGRREALALGGLFTVAGNAWCAVATTYPEFIVARFVAGFGAGAVLTVGQIVLADIAAPQQRARIIAIYQATFLLSVWIGPLPGGLLAERYGLAAPFWFCALSGFGATLVAWFLVAETRGWTGARAGERAPAASVSLATQLGRLARRPGFLLVGLVAFMQAFARTGGLFAIIPLFAVEHVKLSASAIGLAMMVSGFAGFLATYPAGWLADTRGRKWVIVPATLATAVSMVLFGYTASFAWFLMASTVWSIGSSVGSSAPAAYAVDCAPDGMNASAVAAHRMIADAGYVVGPIAMGFAAEQVGFIGTLDATALALVLAALAFGLRAPETVPQR